ncbi:MAG: hypothetical protein NXY57DRAFT_1044292 [Lentinula lateritia]|nr:MAG: hypothetical protein NXY57DRAFT_1044292 [Lentinula lateritia]
MFTTSRSRVVSTIREPYQRFSSVRFVSRTSDSQAISTIRELYQRFASRQLSHPLAPSQSSLVFLQPSVTKSWCKHLHSIPFSLHPLLNYVHCPYCSYLDLFRMGTLDELFPCHALLHYGISANLSTNSSQSHPFPFMSGMSFWIELMLTMKSTQTPSYPAASQPPLRPPQAILDHVYLTICLSAASTPTFITSLVLCFLAHGAHSPIFIIPGTWYLTSWIYIFLEGNVTYKVGRTTNVSHHICEWKRSCPASPKTWLSAIWTPYAHRTGGTTHKEKFIFIGSRNIIADKVIIPIIIAVIATQS